MSDYTITNLGDVEDVAKKFNIDGTSARFPREVVGATQTGFAHQTIGPNEKQPFGHRHHQAEEVYFVISGSGSVKMDDGVHDLRTHDILRVSPSVTRAFAAGPDGLEYVVFGPHHDKDGELVNGYWDQ